MSRTSMLPVHPLGHWSQEWSAQIAPTTWAEVAAGRKKLTSDGRASCLLQVTFCDMVTPAVVHGREVRTINLSADPKCRIRLCGAKNIGTFFSSSARRWLKRIKFGGEIVGALVPFWGGVSSIFDGFDGGNA